MADKKISSKHLQIDKANTSMVIAVAISSFILVFSLIAVKSLISQRNYQARVIHKKETARDQLKLNLSKTEPLINSYKTFVSLQQNVLGGNPNGNGDRDGDNAQIILDSLPSEYDFPALTTSIEKLINSNGLQIESITGSDDQIAQQENSSSANPRPIEIPFVVGVKGSYDNIEKILTVFEKSIRPFSVNKLIYKAGDNSVELSIDAKSYFQPARNFDMRSETVK